MKIYLPVITALLCINTSSPAQQTVISGFRGSSVKEQLETEAMFDAALSAANIGSTIKTLSAKPHNLGSPGSKEVAEMILKKFKSYGFDAHIEIYSVLFPTPKTRVLEMTSPQTYSAMLKEPGLKEDKTSEQPGQLPTYNAWSADGDISAPLVFVNYGLPDDYEMLDRMGISVKGKIVIAKYGRSWRGIKPKVAQERGAIGCIIYSDPMDDGFFQGDVYPAGAFKNEYGVQRGSVLDMVIYPGDPLTPGRGATANAGRIASHNDAANLLKIPVLPISYHDAQPLLAAIGGPVVPPGWAGGLPVTYHVGPGNTMVHLKMEFNWDMVPCYDVIAMIKGAEFPDEWVMRGNHHDAWVNGANDPISGQAALLEEAKAIGEMVKKGWKPKRSLVYCAWDGEEPGLVGSTEWAEDHEAELQKKCVVYINSDGNGRGFLGAGGSHALTPLMDEVAKTVTDPQTGISIFERAKAADIINASSLSAKKEAMKKSSLELDALGSGSDFSPFLQHLGVPSLNLGFGGEDDGGEYHSIYDSYDMYVRFKDPSFEYGVALAKTAGHAALRMANADILPFDFKVLYRTINSYVSELLIMADNMRETTTFENDLVKTGKYAQATDTAKHLQAPVIKDEVPFINFSSLQNALVSLQKATDTLAARNSAALLKTNGNEALNTALYRAEQQLLLASGLPGREWYKHALYAPGFYTGYGVKTLPGIRETLEQRNWKEAQAQVEITAGVIQALAVYFMDIH